MKHLDTKYCTISDTGVVVCTGVVSVILIVCTLNLVQKLLNCKRLRLMQFQFENARAMMIDSLIDVMVLLLSRQFGRYNGPVIVST